MSIENAEFTLYIISAIALTVWIGSFEYLRRVAIRRRSRRAGSAEKFVIEEVGNSPAEAGRVELKGESDHLAAKLASLLAREGFGFLGPVELTHVDSGRVAFKAACITPGRAKAAFRLAGDVEFRPVGSGATAATWTVQAPGSDGLLTAAWIIQGVSLAVGILLFVLMRGFVVENPNSAIRGQVFQMIQIVHFLWLPFLFAGLSSWRERVAEERVRTMISNLPYL
ncbi:MAG: hypothetical protein SFX72_06215 [Isosphaeraceae bacterium]|nr:hypothetical protein [Isosphaeraceae bacterium]